MMKKCKLMGFVLVSSLFFLAGTVQAGLIPGGDFTSGLDGWTESNPGTWTAPHNDGSPDGPSARGTAETWLFQPGITEGLPFVEGQTYTLSFLAALLDGSAGSILQLDVKILTDNVFQVTPTSTWEEYVVQFTPNAAEVAFGSYEIGFIGANNATFGIDSVSMSAVSVPEPSTMVLLLGVLASAVLLRRDKFVD